MVESKTSTLRPGLLVSLKTSVRGNVSYRRKDLLHETNEKIGKDRWETTRTIADIAEHTKAIKVRSKIRSLITGVCVASAFGLLCPEVEEEALEKAMTEARKLAEEFNETASLSRIRVYMVKGRIARDDVEAVQAINSEIRDLMDRMEAGVKNLDAKAIRAAANQAREVGGMLDPKANAAVKMAIEAARKAARDITKAAENAAQEIDLRAVRLITEARTAFLDLGEAAEVAAPVEAGRSLDLGEVGEVKAVGASAPAAMAV